MSLNYAILDDAQAAHLRRQRLLDLEADHFRYVLDAEELPPGNDVAPIMAKIIDVERRITLHRQALGLPVQMRTADEEPGDGESDAGSS